MMKSYLYVLSIGPVQDFIAAARRTRDLWLGSHLLSEISKAAAKRIDDEGGRLIFPNLKKEKLEPSSSPDAPNVANIILAELKLPDQEDPSHLNKRAQAAAQDEWEVNLIDARALVNLDEIDAGCSHPEQHLSRPRRRIRSVHSLDRFETERLNFIGLHVESLAANWNQTLK